MNVSEMMTWKEFRTALVANPMLDLQFQYAEDKWVSPSYHITELKYAPITSVDCGGVVNKWTEIIIQLWEPENQQQLKSMKVRKAISIIELVEKSLNIEADAVVKVEFGNHEYDTRQLLPKAFIKDEENFIIDLRPDVTQCKAIERGGSCGTTPAGEECCTPSAEKPKIQLKNLVTQEGNSCEPGSGCC